MRACRGRRWAIGTAVAAIEAGDWRSKLHPAHVLGSLAAWTAQYELPIWLGGTHEACGRYVERYLYQCVRRVHDEYAAASEAMSSKTSDRKAANVETCST